MWQSPVLKASFVPVIPQVAAKHRWRPIGRVVSKTHIDKEEVPHGQVCNKVGSKKASYDIAEK